MNTINMRLEIIRIALLLVTTSTICSSQNKIIWVEHEYSTINIANIDKTESMVILESFVHYPSTIYIDNETDKIFWGNAISGTIASTDNNLTKFTNHHKGLINPRAIFIDNVNEWIYYGDGNVARVERVRFDGSNEQRLFSDNLGGAIYGLELDIPQNRMFFTTNDNIHVSDLDGNNVSIIVADVGPESLVFDRNGGRLYWSEPIFAGDGFIKSCNLDGSDIVVLPISSKEPQSIDLDFVNQIIYWSDPVERAIYMSNLDGTNKKTLVDLSSQKFLNRITVELDTENNSLYYSTSRLNGINRIDLDQEIDVLFISDAIDSPIEVIVDHEEERIYIADEERGIVSCNLDGSEVQELITLQYIDGIAINENYIYYTHWLDKQIVRMDKDGQNHLAIVDNVCCTSDIEIQNNILYWIDSNKDAIYSSNADGSNITLLVDNVPDARSLKISGKDQKIYWSNRTINIPNNTISSSNLDGSNISTITDTDGVQYIGWLAIDEIHDKIYYSQGTSNPSSIYRVNKDGSEKELVFETKYEARGIDFYLDVTSTHEEFSSILKIYPNPVSEHITIQSKDNLNFNLRLYDISGILLIEDKNTHLMNVSFLSNGLYILEVQDINSKLIFFQRIVVVN